ncbi:hypothetical protein [cf. Phormidesmis sp. LEGE 11477]|uniref:hypothetical protein n=1 Tax=cf. Phormidesmis sp. LEGE 11477 TaxID=1828680 RepID=UPI00187F4BE6|nr:hypothetical protein [cf. Phormidesmis sp. LEGE 11477]MBE9060982.1 hypothetical protein [cf. Phormidesmis sp. LEGE 11477]
MPLEATEAQLEAVDLGGEHVYWDEIGQDFRVSDLKAGIYGREVWMAKIEQQMAIASQLDDRFVDRGVCDRAFSVINQRDYQA